MSRHRSAAPVTQLRQRWMRLYKRAWRGRSAQVGARRGPCVPRQPRALRRGERSSGCPLGRQDARCALPGGFPHALRSCVFRSACLWLLSNANLKSETRLRSLKWDLGQGLNLNSALRYLKLTEKLK